MKICIINSFYYPHIIGGAEVSVQKLAEELHRNNNEVSIICCGEETKKEKINGINIFRIKMINPINIFDLYTDKNINCLQKKIFSYIDKYNFLNFILITKKLKEINPDIVHTNNLYGISPIIWLSCKVLKIPVIHTLRDYSLLFYKCDKEGVFKKINRILNIKLTNLVSIVTSPSQFTLNEFSNNNYFNQSKKFVVYNAEKFNLTEVENIKNKKKKTILYDETIRYVFIGRLEKQKGIDILLNTFSKLKENNIELYIAGDGNLKDLVQDYSKKDKRIHYKGFINQKEIDSLLSKCHILIIPSIWAEPFGRVIIEAYKNALPVIGSNMGGIPELIENKKTGIILKEVNEETLEAAIKYFYNKENIIEMLDVCVEYLEKFPVENQAKRFLELYNCSK